MGTVTNVTARFHGPEIRRNRLSGLVIRATGKSRGEYCRIGILTAFDTRSTHQVTTRDEGDETKSMLYTRILETGDILLILS
jgi:hypothetical protein